MKSLFNTIYNRRSVRSFKRDPIPEHILHQIMESARWTPSGGNGQGHVFGIVTDPDKREALAKAAGNQMWIAEAPVVIACCARLYKPEEESDFSREVNKLRWGKEAFSWFSSCPNPYHMALLFCNATPLIPGAHIQLAAAAHGLGTCWIGYMDINECSNILGLPENVRCYFLMPLGYPAEEKRRPRKPLSEITFGDSWERKWSPAQSYPSFGDLILRPYREDDAAEWINTWAQTAVTSDAWVALHHAKPRYKRPALELVAELNGEIVGFMDVEIESEPEELGHGKHTCCGFVWEFGVRPDCQGLGIARDMLEHAKGWLTERSIRRMEFWSMDERARSFYQHVGMQELERHWQFYMGLPKHLVQEMHSKDGVSPAFIYGTCAMEKLEEIEQLYRVRRDGAEDPKVCIGYDYRW